MWARFKDSYAYKSIMSVFGYVGCMIITLGVMYYLDGTAGIILTAALLTAFIVSLVLTLIVRRSISVDISADKTALTKGEDLKCVVKLANALPLPAPVIEIEAECSPHLGLGSTTLYKGALAGRFVNTIRIPMKALHSGEARMSVKRVTLTDYLGIFAFPINLPEEVRCFKAAIYPDIPDTSVQTDFLKTTNRFQSTDDEEEESDETAINSTGMPGYDHRQYFPGDPIKRINWKLSSKRDIYMIRLDEEIRGAGQMFFLDCPKYEENDYILTVRDTVIEGALTMFTQLIREGREAAFFYCDEGLWVNVDIRAMNDVYLLQEQLSGYSPSEPPVLVPPEIAAAGKTPICFSAATGDEPGSAVQIASDVPEALIITAQSAGVQAITSNCWTISPEFDFRKQIV